MSQPAGTHADAGHLETGHLEPGPGVGAYDGSRQPDLDALTAMVERLDDLDGLPLAEHVTVFESAHELLRSALSSAGPSGA